MNSPQIKLADPQINAQDPWSDDALDRKFCAETLTKFLENQTAALTIGVNGAWGTGKTFFLRRWEQSLKKDGYEVVYFNAWKDDCLDDPLIAIVGQLWKKLKGGTFKEVCDSLKSAAVPVLSKVGLSVLNRGLQIVSGVSVDGINKECLQTGTESAFDQYVSLTDAREDFRTRLQRLADKVFDKTGKPLIYIVDELDRCRPDFAVKVLERIKHLFDIDHVIFVLGIDREQLGYVIQSVYGNIGVENYLLRFIDVDFLLPGIDVRKFFDFLWNRYDLPFYVKKREEVFCEQLDPFDRGAIKSGRIENPIKLESASLKNTIKMLFENHNLTLREIELGLKLYVLALKSTPTQHRMIPELLPSLILMKIKDNKLYRNFLNENCALEEVINFVFPSPIEDSERSWNLVLVLGALCSVLKNVEKEDLEKILNKIENPNLNTIDSNSLECILDTLKTPSLQAKFANLMRRATDFTFSSEEVKYLAQKVDLVANYRPKN